MIGCGINKTIQYGSVMCAKAGLCTGLKRGFDIRLEEQFNRFGDNSPSDGSFLWVIVSTASTMRAIIV